MYDSGQLGLILVTGESPEVGETPVSLSDISDFAAINTIYANYFIGETLACSCFQMSALPNGALFELETVTVKQAIPYTGNAGGVHPVIISLCRRRVLMRKQICFWNGLPGPIHGNHKCYPPSGVMGSDLSFLLTISCEQETAGHPVWMPRR